MLLHISLYNKILSLCKNALALFNSPNDQVQQFNTRIESFPTNMMANMFGFKQADFFEIETPAEREVPKVKF